MEELHISAYCKSDKEGVGIGFGVSFDPEEDSVDTIGTEWIGIGMSGSFWENAFEFDEGIEKADKLMEINPDMEYKTALYSVFGDFTIDFTLDGEEIEFNTTIDVNEEMYHLLMSL